ncbi:MAG: TRAP transporter small permease subunit [Paracoccaceae bacterium]|jgi:TRAP-type mannitol/chloroaromatic compound transport system permease small subunit|nr:TRAP transporter small permease subunit [Paracoccaceae bacterium]MDG1677277.1 TRAP transporter small permease subunit [Paracoccaceae bacterium]MDG2247717.1 TRAP transporter small permease subunit [Paracoccaceae bacterium]|tara:strand:+ start:1016 stop:1951 length:936 start_codon:yes stop_codon:yes gene_type:complete
MENEQTISLASTASAVYDGFLWFFQNLLLSFYNIGYAVSNPGMWLDWSEKKSIMRFVYYGGSVEFFFAVLLIFLALFIVGVFRPAFMWGNIRLLEGFANTVGRFFAWAGLIMVLQQVLIIIMQRIFTRPDIVIGFGIPLSYDISWYAEELKLYNALVVSLCATYTFVQGGHVRVDLFYAGAKFRTKKIVDMFGSIVFMLPMAVLIWMYGWYFLWRHLIVPKPSASDALDRLLAKSRVLKWNVETIGFSPNGFTGYFLFKILLVAFAGMIFIHAWAFFMRSFQELREGQSSENKYRDVDQLPDLTEVVETNN